MRLVYDRTGIEVKIGDEVNVGADGKVTVRSIEKPRHAGSTGRVYVEIPGQTHQSGYFPSVIEAHWIEREDQ